MQSKLFSVYDKKAQAHSAPFSYQYESAAVRAFGDVIADQRSSVSKHPEDYALYCLGTFNEESGEITPHVHPQFIAEAIEFTNNQLKGIPNGTNSQPISSSQS